MISSDINNRIDPVRIITGKISVLVGCSLAAATTLQAQTSPAQSEAGRPFVTNFTAVEYDAEGQNWAVVEDDRGVIFAGNNTGVLEYDGVAWRHLPLPNHTIVRSLARDAQSRIWVGGQGELGYLSSDSLGAMTFVSLLEEVPEVYRNFRDVRNTYATDDGVYFTTAGAIFRWDGQSMQVWPAETSFHLSFLVDGMFYARQWDIGLQRVEYEGTGDALHLVPGGEQFATSRIYVMLPFDEQRILIGTREEGLFLYDGTHAEPFATEADELLAEGVLYQPGATLPGGRFALGTLSNGLVVIDRSGRLVEHVDRQSGLQDNTVFYPYADQAGRLWLGLGRGLSRVEVGSPFTRYDAQSDLMGGVWSIARHEGVLFVGAGTSGVKYLERTTRRFRSIEGPITQAFSLLSVGGDLLVTGVNEGLFRIVEAETQPVRTSISGDYRAVALHQWSRDSNLVLVGLIEGLAVLRRSSTGWVDEGRVPGVDVDAWYMAEATDGALWLGTKSGRVVRVRLPEKTDRVELVLETAEVTIYGSEEGLTEGVVAPFRVGDNIYVAGLGETILVFDEDSGRFTEDSTFDGARSGHPRGNFKLREGTEGRVWIAPTYGAPVVASRQSDGSYAFETLRRFRQDRVVDIYPEADGVVWLVGETELIRYDTSLETKAGGALPPLVRQVFVGEDDLLYAGTGEAVHRKMGHWAGAVSFSYSAPGVSGRPRYRTQLEGFDPDWSAWSTVTDRSYTNLPPGDYRFRVETEGRGEAAYALTVLPPWYRTWWAYGLYAGLLGLLVFGVDRRQRTRMLKKERERAQLREAQLRAEAAEAKAEISMRLQKELNAARDIQMSMIPLDLSVFDKVKEVTAFAALEPAREVGGDFYDYFFVDDGHLCCVVGDVSGKGAAAALFMAVTRTLVNAKGMAGLSPSQIMSAVNNELSRNNDQAMFVTLFIGILDVRNGGFTYSNAGHNPPILLRWNDSQLRIQKRHGPVVGAVERLSYGEDRIDFGSGDKLFMYTDGVTEAMNGKSELYSENRLVSFLETVRTDNPKDIVRQVMEEVVAFAGDAEQADDITILNIEFVGADRS